MAFSIFFAVPTDPDTSIFEVTMFDGVHFVACYSLQDLIYSMLNSVPELPFPVIVVV